MKTCNKGFNSVTVCCVCSWSPHRYLLRSYEASFSNDKSILKCLRERIYFWDFFQPSISVDLGISGNYEVLTWAEWAEVSHSGIFCRIPTEFQWFLKWRQFLDALLLSRNICVSGRSLSIKAIMWFLLVGFSEGLFRHFSEIQPVSSAWQRCCNSHTDNVSAGGAGIQPNERLLLRWSRTVGKWCCSLLKKAGSCTWLLYVFSVH